MPGRRWFEVIVLAGVVCALAVTGALAWGTSVRGRRMVISEGPAGEADRRVVIVGRAPGAALAFEPLDGAYLRVFTDDGQEAQSQLFFLEPEGWDEVSGGYRYVGPGPDGNPVDEVVVTSEPGKAARVRAVLRGDVGTEPLELVRPSSRASGGLSLGVAGGSGRICVLLGGEAGGTTVIDTPSVWRIRSANTDAQNCPPVPSPYPTPVRLTKTLLPVGSGTYREWGEAFPEVGTEHWQNVDDDAGPDEADTFLQDNTWSGAERETFVHEPSGLAPDGAIASVDVCLRARQTDVDDTPQSNGIRILVRSASGEVEHLATAQLPIGWTDYCKRWLKDPTTGTAWTTAGVDGLEIGARNAMSPGGPDGVQMTRVWMVVQHAP